MKVSHSMFGFSRMGLEPLLVSGEHAQPRIFALRIVPTMTLPLEPLHMAAGCRARKATWSGCGGLAFKNAIVGHRKSGSDLLANMPI